MSPSDSIQNAADDAKSEIARLRKQVETLMSERVTPALADAAGRAETAARQATDFTRDQAQALSDTVKEQPLIAIAVAAGVGYLLGRLFR
jgi:ElaB/YqjD/DUF883 family membrane-anchored ribosome-binding protein